ncbi:anti-sigma factor family protein [Gemmatimonas sp.]|uniref:anti-sigma factor family protein n=1 Tax=Gemmatimonas sp. TaxID=1962908 RepID=UPI003983CEE7
MSSTRIHIVPMDCKSFRKQHLAYLDDTLPGDEMAAAQRHVMMCDGCAAHDTLVRRSLMVARSMPTLEPSADFQARLRARLAECRDECRDERSAMAARTALLNAPRSATSRNTRVVMAVAASAMLGAFVWQGWTGASAPELSMQPVIASQPAMPTPISYITPELMQAMATGNPVWPATMIIEDAPTRFVSHDFTLATFSELR